ncbi:hypothetical protein VULLAG_LOCUS80 [Vulpes lagopus]
MPLQNDFSSLDTQVQKEMSEEQDDGAVAGMTRGCDYVNNKSKLEEEEQSLAVKDVSVHG